MAEGVGGVADRGRQVAAEQTQQGVERAKGLIQEQVDKRSTEAGLRLADSVKDLRSVGEELRARGKDGAGRLANEIADRVERVSRYLTGADADRILSDIEGFTRERPWAVTAGGAVAGLAAARLLKASSERRRGAAERGPASGAGTAPPHETTVAGGHGPPEPPAGARGSVIEESAAVPRGSYSGDLPPEAGVPPVEGAP